MLNKKIIKIEQAQKNGQIIIDFKNPQKNQILIDMENTTPAIIIIKNCKYFNQQLAKVLQNYYIRGSQIVIDYDNQQATIINENPKPYYNYSFINLDLSKPMPKSLAEYELFYKGKKTTYRQAIATLTSQNYLPNEIWVAIDNYNQSRINALKEYNKIIDFEKLEQFYKKLQNASLDLRFQFYSPNEKTYFETIAEREFIKDCQNLPQFENLPQYTEQMENCDWLQFLRTNAHYYGVDIPKFYYKTNTRKTKDGYTQEPQRVYCDMSTNERNRTIYDPRNKDGLPKFARHNLQVKSCENSNLLYEAYKNLKWLIDNLGDEALDPNYKRCPHCGKIYNINKGCENCEKIPPIEFVNAENLFYSNANTYEDNLLFNDTYAEMNNETVDYDTTGLDE